MNLLYVAIMHKECTIYTKIKAQIRAFEVLKQKGFINKFSFLNTKKDKFNNIFYINNEFSVKALDTSKYKTLGAFLNIFFNYPRLYCRLIKYIKKSHITDMYIRKPPVFDIFSALFLFRVKFLKVKVFFEIPTYPYDKEFGKHSVLGKLDKIARSFLKKTVYRIVTFSNDDYIFGVRCINISNGVDLRSIKLKDNNKRKIGDKITFTCVAGLSFWHQIDRFLNSMIFYFNHICDETKENIHFNIIGDGSARKYLEEIVENNDCLSGKVTFHGFLYGKELDRIFEETDIAVGNLEETKTRNLVSVQPLKHREYAARGVPFIYGLKDPDFDGEEFIYQISDGAIDLYEIIKWYNQLRITKDDIRNVCDNLTWEKQFEKVLVNSED